MKKGYYYVQLMKLLGILALVLGYVSPVLAEETLKVGVLQYVEHESLNATYQGFIDGLKEAGY